MNVLHISRTMGQGGAEKIVFQLCCNNDVENNVVASTGGDFAERLEKKGVRHYLIPDIDRKNPLLIIKTLVILNNIIKKEKIDIVHSHHRMAAFYAKLLQIIHKHLKHVYTAHNVFYGKRSLMRFALRNSQIVACGDTVKQNLIEEYRIEEDRIKLIYNAVDAPDFRKVEKTFDTQGRPCIGTIGRLSKQKGIDIFLKAIGYLKEKYPMVLGVIIGDGEDKDKLIGLSEKLGIQENVVFLGYRSDVFSIIKSVDFIALCSRWEGFPLTPIETFAMRKTIVASNIKNNLEIIIDGYNGKIFEKDNYLDLANRILELFDPQYRAVLEERAFLSYTEKYSYDHFIKEYKDIYLGDCV